MEAGQFLKLSLALVRDVETGRVLSLGCPDALNVVLGCRLETVEDARLCAGFRGRQITWHRFGCTWRGNVGSTGADDNTGCKRLSQPRRRPLTACSDTASTGSCHALLATELCATRQGTRGWLLARLWWSVVSHGAIGGGLDFAARVVQLCLG